MNNEKQMRIVEMAKDICRAKLNCNDVCNPISACDALKYAERAVEAGYVKQSGWISVNERLPEESGRFLLVDDEGYMFTASWYTTSGWFMPFCHGNAITHWMPLPEAPKMKGE